MYFEECLARDRRAERLRRAHDELLVSRLAELSRMRRRQERAERRLLDAWQRVDRLRAVLGSGG